MAKFKWGSTICHDEHSSGRPNEVTTPEMVKEILEMVLDDSPIVHELADMVGVSKSAVHRIFTEIFDMRKLCDR